MFRVSCSTALDDIECTGSILEIPSIAVSQVWCSTSSETIEYTWSIRQIHSIPMSQVWSFEDID